MFDYDLIVIHDIQNNTWIIKIKYMVLRNAKYKYIHGDLLTHTSTSTVWILKIQVHTSTWKPSTHAMSECKYLYVRLYESVFFFNFGSYVAFQLCLRVLTSLHLSF